MAPITFSSAPSANYSWPAVQGFAQWQGGPSYASTSTPGLPAWPTQANPNGQTFLAAPTHNPFLQGKDVPPQTQKEDEKTKTEKQPSDLAKAWKKFVLFAPIVGFLGSGTLILGAKTSLLNPILKVVGRAPLPVTAADQKFKNIGQKSLGIAVLLKSLGGISAGVVSGQPSMIWGNLIQLIPSGILAFKKSNHLQNFATSMEMLLGGLYTIGFANELKNKDPGTAPDKIRRYDMTRLKSIFNHSTQLSMEQRFTGLLSTLGSMAAFTIQDHVLLFKDLGKKLFNHQSKRPEEKEQTLKEKLSNWTKQPSAIKSQLAVLFFYMGTLPILLLTRKNPKIGEKRSIVALKAIGMSIANAAPFAIAMNRDDLRGKAPLIGAPMAVIGMSNSRNPFFVGLGHLGESFNDLFFSDVAVNGVKTKSEPNAAAPAK